MHQMFFRLTLIGAALCLTSAAHSQLFDFGSKTNTPSDTQTQAAPPSKTMSSDEFKANVTKLGKQTDDAITQESNKQFLKNPPIPEPAMGPPESDSSNNSRVVVPPVPETPAPSPVQQNYQAPPAPNYIPPPPTTAQPQYQPPPSQNQPYTGFGPGNNQGPAPSSSGSNSGGWNIKY